MNQPPSPNTLANSRHVMANTPHPLQSLDAIAAIRPCHMRQEICRQGQMANTWYRVLAGAASCCIIKSDGRRQIVDLLFPGDFFGFTACAEYDYSVETAASGTIVAGYPRKRVETLADSNPKLTRQLRQIAFDALSRRQEQLLIVGRVTVPQKVGSFILAMADRLSQDRTDRVTLPISRYDIADYLAVSVETVSRALSDLKQRGLIRFTGTRDIQIVDREALEDCEHDDIAPRTPALAARIST
jgi:CRP/FNR family transcriptional regulator, nitrogen fixation regulation protein